MHNFYTTVCVDVGVSCCSNADLKILFLFMWLGEFPVPAQCLWQVSCWSWHAWLSGRKGDGGENRIDDVHTFSVRCGKIIDMRFPVRKFYAWVRSHAGALTLRALQMQSNSCQARCKIRATKRYFFNNLWSISSCEFLHCIVFGIS